MFKSFHHKYMSSAAFLRNANNDAGAAEKTPAELAAEARGNIKVDVSSRSVEEAGETEDDNSAQTNSEDAGETDNSDENDDDDNGEKDPPEDETEEQKQERLAKEKEDKQKEREQRKQERQQRKWDRLAAEKKAAEEEVERLRAQLAEKPADGLTEEEVERRAQAKAEEALKIRQAKDAEADFDKRNLAIYNDAVKADKEFDKNIGDLVKEIGLIPRPLVYILSELDNQNGADVMSYLAKPDNVDEAEEVWSMSERQMTQKLIRISDKLKDAKKAPPRKQSAVPPPVNPIAENGRRNDTMPKNPTQNMDEFIRIRNKQIDERRKAKGY
jgi:hypothetical protein